MTTLKLKYFTLILLLGVFAISACKTNKFKTSAEVWTVKQSNDMLVLGARGYANNEREAILNAEKRAFETLFYQGISNSSYKLPMIHSSERNNAFLDSFFETGDYRNFITSSSIISPLAKNKVKNTKELDIELNINTFALRRHLEENGVIKKFGF